MSGINLTLWVLKLLIGYFLKRKPSQYKFDPLGIETTGSCETQVERPEYKFDPLGIETNFVL